MASTVDAVGDPIPTSAVLMASPKHIATRCRAENVAFLQCKKNDPNPEKCLDKGQQVTRCVLALWNHPLHKMVSLKNIVPAASNNVNAEFILLDKGNPTREGQERTCIALVADETAAVHFQLWGNECDAFEAGDIIRLSNGIFSYHRNNLLLRAGKRGKAEKVGDFVKVFVETPNMSEIRWGPDPNNPKKFIQEAVISPYSRIFPPLP